MQKTYIWYFGRQVKTQSFIILLLYIVSEVFLDLSHWPEIQHICVQFNGEVKSAMKIIFTQCKVWLCSKVHCQILHCYKMVNPSKCSAQKCIRISCSSALWWRVVNYYGWGMGPALLPLVAVEQWMGNRREGRWGGIGGHLRVGGPILNLLLLYRPITEAAQLL